MKPWLWLSLCLLVAGCATDSERMALPPPEGMPHEPLAPPATTTTAEPTLQDLQRRLGLSLDPADLGYEEARFDSCELGYKTDYKGCGRNFLSVVHFRLLCRDSVETVQSVAVNLTPLVRNTMQWRLAGIHGETRTDNQGFGQVQVVSPNSTKGQRFILIIGSKSLGLEVGEVSQIVLPGNWCSEMANHRDGSDLGLVPEFFAIQN